MRSWHFWLMASTRRVTLPYGATVHVDAALGGWFLITATDGSAVAIADAANGTLGQTITITVSNATRGALGTVAWGPAYKLAGWTSPAPGRSRSITFAYDGTHWIEVGRTATDVPN